MMHLPHQPSCPNKRLSCFMMKCRLDFFVPPLVIKRNSRVGNMLAKYSKHRSSSKKQCSTFIKELCHQFSLDDLKKATNNFDKDRKIGQVNGNIVYKGYVKYNGENDYPIALLRIRRMVIEREFKNQIEFHC